MHVKALWILIYMETMLYVFVCVCVCVHAHAWVYMRTAILFASVCLTLITSEPINEFTLNLV